MATEFIGGPLDGHVREIAGAGHAEYVVAESLPIDWAAALANPDPAAVAPWREHRYRPLAAGFYYEYVGYSDRGDVAEERG